MAQWCLFIGQRRCLRLVKLSKVENFQCGLDFDGRAHKLLQICNKICLLQNCIRFKGLAVHAVMLNACSDMERFHRRIITTVNGALRQVKWHDVSVRDCAVVHIHTRVPLCLFVDLVLRHGHRLPVYIEP